MPRMSIVLTTEEARALCDLAVREWREPRQQVGFLIAEALRRAGALPAAEHPTPELTTTTAAGSRT